MLAPKHQVLETFGSKILSSTKQGFDAWVHVVLSLHIATAFSSRRGFLLELVIGCILTSTNYREEAKSRQKGCTVRTKSSRLGYFITGRILLTNNRSVRQCGKASNGRYSIITKSREATCICLLADAIDDKLLCGYRQNCTTRGCIDDKREMRFFQNGPREFNSVKLVFWRKS